MENRSCLRPDGIDHSNVLVYDKKTNTIERFEPHGSSNDFDQDVLDSWLSDYVKHELSSKIKYINPSSVCPMGLQTLHEKTETHHTGFCGLWTIWYLDLRLSYPDVPSDKLLKIASKHLKELGFTTFIYNYSRFVINFTKEFKKKYSKILDKYLDNYDNVDVGKHFFFIDFIQTNR